jgi:hypothetical protein
MNLNQTLTIHPQTKANQGNIQISKATQVFQSGQPKNKKIFNPLIFLHFPPPPPPPPIF